MEKGSLGMGLDAPELEMFYVAPGSPNMKLYTLHPGKLKLPVSNLLAILTFTPWLLYPKQNHKMR